MSEQTVAAVVHRIRMWLVQHDRYNGSTIELDELLTREIGALVRTERAEEPAMRVIAALRGALELIAGDCCERVTHGSCWDHPEWTVDAPFTADRVCDTCIARRALSESASPRTEGPQEGSK